MSQTKEEILENILRKEMNNHDHETFKSTHGTLYNCILKAMEDYLEVEETELLEGIEDLESKISGEGLFEDGIQRGYRNVRTLIQS